jgi:hypothetical protein
MTTEIDARLELIARMMPTMIATVIPRRLLQFFIDELGDDDDDIEDERERLE